MSERERALRWAEDLARHYEISFREEERKEEVLDIFRRLASLEERRRVGIPDLSWRGPAPG